MCTSVYEDNYIRHDACVSNGIVTTHGFIFRIRDVNQVIHIPTSLPFFIDDSTMKVTYLRMPRE